MQGQGVFGLRLEKNVADLHRILSYLLLFEDVSDNKCVYDYLQYSNKP